MRPGQNKQRMRGRNNNNNSGRKGPNPLTRSFESNGPDVKIRGTAQHIGEKYLQLARDAQTSGDPVSAENYLQHAEHYFRLISAAQQAQQQALLGANRPEGENDDADEDDDVGGLPDRFASPFDRQIQPPVAPPALAAQGADQPRQDQQPRGEYQPQPRADYQQPRQDYQPRQERSSGEYQRPERQDNRGNSDRPPYQGNGQERSGQDRNGQDRNGQDRNAPRENRWQRDNRQNRPNNDQQREFRAPRPPREGYVPREQRDNFAPRENVEQVEIQAVQTEARVHEPRQIEPRQVEARQVEPAVGLPAFITTPVRVPVSEPESHAPEAPSAHEADAPAPKPRVTRRRKVAAVDAPAAASED